MPTGAVTDKDVVAQPTNARAPRVRAAIVTIAPALGLYLVAVLAYAFVIRDQALPVVDPDEFTYGHLARSIADGDGFTWRGAHISLRAALYVFLIVPSFLVTSGADAYRLAQHEGLLFGCLVIRPFEVVGLQYGGRNGQLLAFETGHELTSVS